MTSMEDMINDEYKLVTDKSIPFEMIMTDSYDWLVAGKHLTPSIQDIREAKIFVNVYRMIVRQKQFRLQEDQRPPVVFAPTKEDKERVEIGHKKNLVKKVLVANWYSKKKEEGLNKLFLLIEQQ